MKNADTVETSTCDDENKNTTTSENGADSQPPEKKKRLSNREYKKLKKGQNKVSMKRFVYIPYQSMNTIIHEKVKTFLFSIDLIHLFF